MKEEAMLGRKELDTNALLVLRTFVNLFDGKEGRELLVREYERVCSPHLALLQSRMTIGEYMLILGS